jgi:hypothetical protein
VSIRPLSVDWSASYRNTYCYLQQVGRKSMPRPRRTSPTARRALKHLVWCSEDFQQAVRRFRYNAVRGTWVAQCCPSKGGRVGKDQPGPRAHKGQKVEVSQSDRSPPGLGLAAEPSSKPLIVHGVNEKQASNTLMDRSQVNEGWCDGSPTYIQ